MLYSLDGMAAQGWTLHTVCATHTKLSCQGPATSIKQAEKAMCYELDMDNLLKHPAKPNVVRHACNCSIWDQEFKDHLRCTVS